MVEQFAELLAKERRDDGRRCLIGSQTMCVGGTHDAGLDKSVVLIHTHQCFHDEGHKAQVVYRGLTGSVQQYAGIGREAPVVVLSRTVDACKGLFVQQGSESVLACHLLHQQHQQHVVIYCQVGFLKDRSHLELVGSHLVVTCLAGDAQLECCNLKVFHEGLNTVGDGAEIVVFHLLVLG